MSAVRGLHQQRVNPQPAETQRHRSTALPGDLRDRFARARHSVSSPSSSLNGFRVERAAAEERENTSLRKRGPSALSRRHHTALPTDVQRAPLTCCAADADESAGTNRRDSRDPETDVATRDHDGRSSNLILGWPHSLIHSRRHCFAHRTQRAPSHSATSPTRRRRSVSSCPPHQFLTAELPDRAASAFVRPLARLARAKIAPYNTSFSSLNLQIASFVSWLNFVFPPFLLFCQLIMYFFFLL